MIIPGILEKSLDDIAQKVRLLEPVASLVQIDVADDILVSGATFQELEKLSTIKTALKFEIHLMVQNPHKYVVKLHNVSNYLSQVEADHLGDFIKKSKEYGYKTGLAISPDTPNQQLADYLEQIDFVQFMGVAPGAQNRPFEPKVLEKIRDFRLQYPHFEIQVDGHMNEENINMLKYLEVDHFIVGSDIFNDTDPVNKFKELTKNVRTR